MDYIEYDDELGKHWGWNMFPRFGHVRSWDLMKLEGGVTQESEVFDGRVSVAPAQATNPQMVYPFSHETGAR